MESLRFEAPLTGPEPSRGRSDLGPDQVTAALSRALEACTAWRRQDLAERLRMAADRLARPSTLICVVGEYKRGKSLLVNALLGADVCPVDDDVATTVITVVHGAETPAVSLHRSRDGEALQEVVELKELRRFVTDNSMQASRDRIELAEVAYPSPALADGLTIVDTPGVGGFLSTGVAGTIRFLEKADAAIFVTDASQELTAPEVAFLERARAACPLILVVTKTDLYPDWRRIVALDRQHLVRRKIDLDPVPVASRLQLEALVRADPQLGDESGVPGLLTRLHDQVGGVAKRQRAGRAVEDIRWVLRRLLDPIEAELAILDGAEGLAGSGVATAQLRATETRLRALQAAGARWSLVLNDGFTDLRSEVEQRVRSEIRALLVRVDEELETIDPRVEWEPFAASVERRLAETIAGTLEVVEERTRRISVEIATLLADDAQLPDLASPDAAMLTPWEHGRPGFLQATDRMTGAVSTGIGVLRGAASGVVLLGVVGNLAGLALAGPASLGAAVVFGAKQVADTRQAALKQRRQDARAAVRRHIEEVNLELAGRARQLVQESHRTFRDHYAARLQELSHGATAALQSAQESLAKDRAARQERADRLRRWGASLRRQLDDLAHLEGLGSS